MNPIRPSRHEELLSLLSAYCDGTISAAAGARLETLLRSGGESRSIYVEYLHLHQALRATQVGADWPSAEFPISRSTTTAPSDAAPANRSRIFGFLADAVRVVPGGEFIVGGLVLLAVTGAVWGVIHFTRGIRQTEERRTLASSADPSAGLGVGSLATDDRARWAQMSSAPMDATVRVGRRYELAAGCAKIELTRGTTVAIEGPAIWQLPSDERLQLESGKLLAFVPKTGVGFTVVTPTAEVVDLGTEFGVEVDSQGATELHVIRGRVELKSTATAATPAARKQQVVAGQAVRVSASGDVASPIPLDRSRFAAARAARTLSTPAVARSGEPWPEEQPIWLGNLFDDRPRTPLTEAMRTDTFRAVPTFNNTLGVVRLLNAGSPVKEIAPGVSFDLTNLGWEDSAYAEAQVTNDAWYAGSSHADQNGARGGIRTRGQPMGHNEPRIEEGIGAHANALITFDLDEIRAAGGLARRALEFRCDRAGINDARIGVAPEKPASVHMAAIVSTAEGVRQVVVDGRPVEIAEHDHVWHVAQAIGEPLRADGRFAEFQVSLPADAKWLTLLSASAGDGHFADHTVWSGARLEVKR